jgi:hypothetical protein
MGIEKFNKNLGGMMPSALVNAFTTQVEERGSKIKRSLAAAVKLWIELPPDLQGLLLDQSLPSDTFRGIKLKKKLVMHEKC